MAAGSSCALLEPDDTIGCCTINWIEIYTGMRPGEEHVPEAFLERFSYYDVTRQIAARAGRLRYEWRRQGQTLTLADAAIAAVAIDHGPVLLTDNRRHFPMPELSMHPLPV